MTSQRGISPGDLSTDEITFDAADLLEGGPRRSLRRWLRKPFTFIPLLILLVLVGASVLAPLLAPHDPTRVNLADRLIPPIWSGGTTDYLLGTDRLGRDVLSRIMHAGQWSLATATGGVVIAAAIGVTLGLLAGYLRGRVDWMISLVISSFMAFPTIVLALSVIAAFGPSFRNLIVVLGLAGWPQYARVIRAEVYALRERDFITAARVLGLPTRRVLRKHLLPNVTNSILVLATLQIAIFILVESFLSYLGLGIQPPSPSWGGMLNDGRDVMQSHPWIAAIPGLMILITTLTFNMIGDSVSEYLNPKSHSAVKA